MDNFEHIDLLIGEALECMVEAAGELREMSIEDNKNRTLRIGRAISELWEVRSEIYQIKPEIKRDFFKEYEKDKQRYDYLDDIRKKAFSAENDDDKDEALLQFRKLLGESKSGYFTLLAQAGLYRLMIEET